MLAFSEISYDELALLQFHKPHTDTMRQLNRRQYPGGIKSSIIAA